MNDHVRAKSRLAMEHPVVCVQMPDWTTELLAVLVLVVGIGALAALGQAEFAKAQARRAEAEIERWKSRALAVEASPTVRIEPNGHGFKCVQFNVRREWERAIADQCQRLGTALLQAHAAP